MSAEPQPNPPRTIEFHAGGHERFPAPYPAVQNVPDWYKNLPPEVAGPDDARNRTIKRCIPFLEAITAGYIIPVTADITFTRDAQGGLSFEAQSPVNPIETHGPVQYRGTPFASALIVKFMNPWSVKTPPGYSALFLPALNRFHIPFLVLSGVVETDNYYREINFPAICQMPPNSRFVMQKGTPLVQVIPFKRDRWESVAKEWDQQKRAEMEDAMVANLHLYKDEHWVKKIFG
jgi:hypothetical protein